MRHKTNEGGQDLLAHEVARELEHTEHGVDVPALVRRKALRGEANLRRHPELEFVVGDLEEGEQLADEYAHVLLVDERVRELERAPPDRDVAVAEAVEDDVPVPLHGVRVDRDDLVERVQCDITIVLHC